ncbi:hypothetical protein [Blastopirellula marina]|uniref:Uncharacterized protein n=1 Tax=Blastopirellula marina TaxID=124 RepID=A0A2S8GEG4_9BACT|nr:hypothetical protein [Blastopirellula marina]PQO42848.1 hypothetical protein C5Y98_01470 [Blastopirellula marina]PTL46614.1 hypothetical protein C5Y97_01470 [Blastopirellula marina]
MTVLTADVGRKTECPDCGHIFEIKKAEIKLEIPEEILPEDEYGLKDVSHDHDEARRKMGQNIMSQAEKEIKEQAERKDLNKKTQGAFEERRPRERELQIEGDEHEPKPRESLTPEDYQPRDELVDFPLSFTPKELARDVMLFSDVGLLMRWVFLSIFAAVTLYFAVNAIYYGSLESQTIVTYLSTFMYTVLSVVLGAGTLAFLGSYFLFLVMTVSTGLEEWEWPEIGIFDRVMEALFMIVALSLTMVPFGIMITIDKSMAWPCLFIPGVAFPLVYLGMLDQGTVLSPWSNTIMVSLFQIPVKWLMFFGATLGLLVVCCLVGYGMFAMAGIERLAYIALPGGVLVVGYFLAYAIWLGRLSWEISELHAEYKEEDAESKTSSPA